MKNTFLTQIIEQSFEDKNPFLDLANCGLTELPEVLMEMWWVEELNLGEFYYIDKGKEYTTTFNKGNKNNINFNIEKNVKILNKMTKVQLISLIKLEIVDISFLQHLNQLNSLYLGFNSIIDISFLKNLTNLNLLYLDGNQISDISSLQNLTELNVLFLSRNQISDISSLQNLNALNMLELDENQINDIFVIQNLVNLSSLRLDENQINDISVLRNLTKLNSLELNKNSISDISVLKNLTELTVLELNANRIDDISILKNLTKLDILFLGDNNIADISALKNLTTLTTLDLGNNRISEIHFLKGLKKLDILDLTNNHIKNIDVLYNLKQLNYLFLNHNPIPYIPKEIYEQDHCATALKSYWQELESNKKTTNTQLKIMFLGNGCTGKTTLLHWFIDDAFKDIGLESRTHGIFIKPLKLCKGDVLGNFWDFGGQEVYHATHRLFLGRRTLYILVWATETPETENELRHPPQYWLDMIADIGDKSERSRVLIVQNLFDNQAANWHLLTREEFDNYTERGLDIEFVNTNAKTGKNIPSFKLKVEEEVADLLKIKPEILPETWVNIRTKVAERRENKEKTLTFADFEQICADCKLTGDPSVILGYLHRAGEVFYYEKQFNNQIILDQEWALKAVYAVLKNTNKEQFNRPFKLNLLIDIWQKEDAQLTVEDAQIFLNFMLSNHIMFSTETHSFDKKDTKFVIPQLLIDELPIGAKSSKNRPDAVIHRIDYAFLHRDIIERFIVNTAQFSKNKEYWKNGIFIEFNNAFAIVEVLKENDKNKINIECFGANKTDLLLKIREEFNKIRPLDKAKEYRLINDNLQEFNWKLNQKDVEKSGFDAPTLLQINEKNDPSLMELFKNDLNKLIEKGKIEDVLNRLIEHYSTDLEEQRKARLLLSRNSRNEDENHQALITHTEYSTELNRINNAVLAIISAL